MALAKAMIALVILGLCSSVSAGGSVSLDQVVSETKDLLGSGISEVVESIQTIIEGLFGAANTFATQIPSEIEQSLETWDGLKNLDIQTSIDDFLNELSQIKLPTSVLQAETQITDFLQQFCTQPVYSTPIEVPSNCIGKSLVVRLAPWSCSLNIDTTVACTPPFIEIITTPASCSAKYNTAARFVGQSCVLQKTIGPQINETVGGGAFSVTLPSSLLTVSDNIVSSLLP